MRSQPSQRILSKWWYSLFHNFKLNSLPEQFPYTFERHAMQILWYPLSTTTTHSMLYNLLKHQSSNESQSPAIKLKSLMQPSQCTAQSFHGLPSLLSGDSESLFPSSSGINRLSLGSHGCSQRSCTFRILRTDMF
jgi:hypothetical protein